MGNKAVLAINSAWNIVNFRSGLVRALQADGWEVIAMAPRDAYAPRVEDLGCRLVEMPMQPGGVHPWRDWQLYRRYEAALAIEQPDVYLGFTIKPNVWGTLAAHRLGIPVINNIAGLGTAFIRRSWLTPVARALYRHALRHSFRVLFQNEDDRRYFIESGLVDALRTGRVPGSGVDLDHFACLPLPPARLGRSFQLLFIGRLLRDKGLLELVQAMRELKASRVNLELSLLGFVDADNRSAVSLREVRAWQDQGLVRYLGSTDDVRPFVAAADAVVLPSYREGVPRTLLEAAALGRPLIASDAVGCRDVVDDGVNGLLARVCDAKHLADQIRRLCELEEPARAAMAGASRLKVEREFDESIVIQTYRRVLVEAIAPRCNAERY